MNGLKRWWPILESVGSITSVIVESETCTTSQANRQNTRTGTLSFSSCSSGSCSSHQSGQLMAKWFNDHHGGHERGCDTFKSFKRGIPWDFAVQARGHHNTEKLGDTHRLWLEKHVREINTFGRAVPLPLSSLDLMAFLSFTSLRQTVIKLKKYKFTSP